MTEVILRHREARAGELGLFPCDEEGSDLLHKIKVGKEIGCTIVQRRNPKHHRLFFAILKFMQMHCPMFDEVPIEKIKDIIKIATGLTDTFIDSETGKTFYVLRSISFAAMEQGAFNEFFDEACRQIARRYMPAGTTPEDVRKELLAMVDGPGALGSKVA